MPVYIKKLLIVISAVFGIGGSIATSDVRFDMSTHFTGHSSLEYHLHPGQKMTITVAHRIDEMGNDAVCDHSYTGNVPGYLSTGFVYFPSNDLSRNSPIYPERLEESTTEYREPNDLQDNTTETSALAWTTYQHPIETSRGTVINGSELEGFCEPNDLFSNCPIWDDPHGNSLQDMNLYRDCIYTHRYVVENISNTIQAGEMQIHSRAEIENYNKDGERLFPTGMYFIHAQISNYFD